MREPAAIERRGGRIQRDTADEKHPAHRNRDSYKNDRNPDRHEISARSRGASDGGTGTPRQFKHRTKVSRLPRAATHPAATERTRSQLVIFSHRSSPA